eukprot:7726604-Pyramimonas_sp.AAC.1
MAYAERAEEQAKEEDDGGGGGGGEGGGENRLSEARPPVRSEGGRPEGDALEVGTSLLPCTTMQCCLFPMLPP